VEPTASDADRVELVLRGEVGAFRPLVETYEAAVFGLCRRLLRDATEAEDLSQETFLRAYRRLAELEDPNRFGAWLFQIARSLCRDRVRRRITERVALERHVQQIRWTAVDSDGAAPIVDALNELPEAERRALEFKYFDGLSYEEIAARLGLTFARVDHLIRRARSRLGRRFRVSFRRETSV